MFTNKKLRKILRQLRNIKVLSDKFSCGKCLYLSILWWNKVAIKSVKYLQGYKSTQHKIMFYQFWSELISYTCVGKFWLNYTWLNLISFDCVHIPMSINTQSKKVNIFVHYAYPRSKIKCGHKITSHDQIYTCYTILFERFKKHTDIKLNTKPTHTDLCTKPTLSLTWLISITILNICLCVCVLVKIIYREYCAWFG